MLGTAGAFQLVWRINPAIRPFHRVYMNVYCPPVDRTKLVLYKEALYLKLVRPDPFSCFARLIKPARPMNVSDIGRLAQCGNRNGQFPTLIPFEFS